MTDQKIYADNFRCTFDDPGDFIQFLKERKENSRWMTAPSRNLVFESLEKNTQMGELYLKLYDHDGRAEIIADTMENTSLLLKVNGETYPVRSCAIKSILERARISGHALNKVSKSIFTQILNYCMDVASGDSLIKVADDKVSAVHGGDPKDYAILEILPLVQCVRSILDRDFAGNHFLTANFDHSIVTAIWSLDGQANELMETYRQAVAEKGVTEAMSARPGLRFTTSDVGVSAANLYPILLLGGSKSGKSMLGQRLTRRLADGGPMIYWATLEPRDGEDRAIVRRHLAEREGWGFQTLERGRELPRGLAAVPPESAVLFDSVTACLACQMFSGPSPDAAAPERTAEELLAVSRRVRHLVCVCDEIWRDGVTYETWTETYRRGLAAVCRALAAEFDAVAELSAGCVRIWKGELPDA